MSATDFVHPVSGLRLLRATLPPAGEYEKRAKAAAERAAADKAAAEKTAADARRTMMLERLKGPVQIRPEQKDRDLEIEEKVNADIVGYHHARCKQETDAVREKFTAQRERARCKLYTDFEKLNAKLLRAIATIPYGTMDERDEILGTHHYKLCEASSKYRSMMRRFSPEAEEWKIREITTRRAELAWTCPNDGKAYPFTWQGRQYHRTYDGEVWRTQNWIWTGHWTGNYITSSGGMPYGDEGSREICEALDC